MGLVMLSVPKNKAPLQVSVDFGSPIQSKSRNNNLSNVDLNATARANSFARSPKRMNKSMQNTDPNASSFIKGMTDTESAKYIARLEEGKKYIFSLRKLQIGVFTLAGAEQCRPKRHI